MNRKKILCLIIVMTIIFPLGVQSQDIKKIKKYFKMDLQQLLKAEVTTAGKKKEKVGDIPASVVLVYREDIETYGFQSLSEILESIPGLYTTDDYLSQNTGIRGFWSITPNRNMIVLVNGVPIRDELTGSYPLENIAVPVEAIDKIEVVRGPMSVVYGNGAFFGVINIITNQRDAPFNMVSVSAGTENSMKMFARASGNGKDYHYVFNGSYYKTDGIDVELEKMGGPAYAGLRTENKLERNEKYFNFSGAFKNFSFEAGYSESRKESMVLYPSLQDGMLTKYTDLRFSAGYNKKFSDTLRIETKLGYFSSRLNFDYDMLFPDFYGVQENGADGFNAALNLFITPSPDLDITVGLDYLHVSDVTNQYSFPFFQWYYIHHNLADGEAMITRSIFSQMTYSLSDNFKIVAGLRLEQMPKYVLEERVVDINLGTFNSTEASYEDTDIEFIPRLALIYSPSERHAFKLLYGKAINRPSFFQNMDLLINPSLPPLHPETIQTLELNYIGQVTPKLTVNLSVFSNVMDKLIYRTLMSGDVAVDTYHANVGEMNTVGVEGTVTFIPLNNLRFELSGSYHDTEDKRQGFENIAVAYSPKFLGYFKASYFINKNISLAVNGNYVGEMESYYDDTLPIPHRLGNKVDGYFLLGGNLRIRNIFGTRLFMNLRVSNLLDEEYYYPTTSNNTQFAANGTLGRGRSFLLTVGWKF